MWFSQSFIFFGFLVIGEEIESKYQKVGKLLSVLTAVTLDPFGYDKNDLVSFHVNDGYVMRRLISLKESWSLYIRDNSQRIAGYHFPCAPSTWRLGVCGNQWQNILRRWKPGTYFNIRSSRLDWEGSGKNTSCAHHLSCSKLIVCRWEMDFIYHASSFPVKVMPVTNIIIIALFLLSPPTYDISH